MTAVPFNGLGQIIASGGVQSVALMLAGGMSLTGVSIALENKYDGIPISAIDTMIELAESGILAASKIGEQTPGAVINEFGIPVIPGILGENAEGNRFVSLIEAEQADTGEDILSWNYTPTFESLDTLFGEIFAQWQQWACDSPDFGIKLGIPCPDDVEPVGNWDTLFDAANADIGLMSGTKNQQVYNNRLVFVARGY